MPIDQLVVDKLSTSVILFYFISFRHLLLEEINPTTNLKIIEESCEKKKLGNTNLEVCTNNSCYTETNFLN